MDSMISAAMDYARGIFANDFSGHDFFHTERVFRLATEIAAREGAELLTVQLAALLHDVDDRKLSPETCAGKLNAVRFLREAGVSEEKIAEIVRIIGQVSFAGTDSVTPDTLEGKCVQDADRLDAIGAIGIARTFAYGGNRHRPMYDPSVPPQENMNAQQYHSDKTSPTVNHFYEKLLLLKDMMGTETAREMAEHRHQYMKEFLDEFYAEWDGTR